MVQRPVKCCLEYVTTSERDSYFEFTFYIKLRDRSDASFVALSSRIGSCKPVPKLRNFKAGLSSTSRSSNVCSLECGQLPGAVRAANFSTL